MFFFFPVPLRHGIVKVAGLRCMLVRAHCVSELARPRRGVLHSNAGHVFEPLFFFWAPLRGGSGSARSSYRTCQQVRGARQHPRHCFPARHWRAHGRRAQHVSCRDPRPSQPGCGVRPRPVDSAREDFGAIVVPRPGVDLQDDAARAVQARLQALEDLRPHRPFRRDACCTDAVSGRRLVQPRPNFDPKSRTDGRHVSSCPEDRSGARCRLLASDPLQTLPEKGSVQEDGSHLPVEVVAPATWETWEWCSKPCCSCSV